MKFVHAADVHLDSPLRGLDAYEGAPLEALHGATRRAFENLVQLCLDEQVAFLLLSGDLYDGDWRDFNTGLYFARQMARLGEAGIEVALVRGNHDAASRITRRLRHPSGVHCFSHGHPETLALEGHGVALHGQSFSQPAETERLARGYPEPRPGWLNIGLLHTALDGREGHDPYAPCSVDELRARGYDYWALGHVHRREIVCEQPWIVFPGCLQGRHVHEAGPKGCTLVTVDDGRIASVEHREVDVLRWATVTVDAGDAPSEELLDARIRGALERAKGEADGRLLAVRVRLEGRASLHEAMVREPQRFVEQVRALGIEAGTDELWIERVVLATEPSVSAEAQSDRADGVGDLLRVLEEVLANEALVSDLEREHAKLLDRLPGEVRRRGTLTDWRDPRAAREALMRARELLLARLGGPEGGP